MYIFAVMYDTQKYGQMEEDPEWQAQVFWNKDGQEWTSRCYAATPSVSCSYNPW